MSDATFCPRCGAAVSFCDACGEAGMTEAGKASWSNHCPQCFGEGVFNGQPCHLCDGTGQGPNELTREELNLLARQGSVEDAIKLFTRLGWTITKGAGNSYGCRGVARDGRVCLFGGSHGDDGDEPSLWAEMPTKDQQK